MDEIEVGEEEKEEWIVFPENGFAIGMAVFSR